MLDTAFQEDVSSGSFSPHLLLGICFSLLSLYQSVVVVVVLFFTFAKGKGGGGIQGRNEEFISAFYLSTFFSTAQIRKTEDTGTKEGVNKKGETGS